MEGLSSRDFSNECKNGRRTHNGKDGKEHCYWKEIMRLWCVGLL